MCVHAKECHQCKGKEGYDDGEDGPRKMIFSYRVQKAEQAQGEKWDARTESRPVGWTAICVLAR
jgi:hypothetical protein